MNTENENSISPDHPHGKADPRWITGDGRCLLCADSYHKSQIKILEERLMKSWAETVVADVRRSEALEALAKMSFAVHIGYDFNADSDGITLIVGRVFADQNHLRVVKG